MELCLWCSVQNPCLAVIRVDDDDALDIVSSFVASRRSRDQSPALVVGCPPGENQDLSCRLI
jgi:hypothetical protein